MSISRLLCIALMLLIATQSAFANATSTPPHQIDSTHLQASHSHTNDALNINTDTQSTHDISDCHHCGHCSGSHVNWFMAAHLSVLPPYGAHTLPATPKLAKRSFIEPNFRPPIV